MILLAQTAMSFLGTPYIYGGNTRYGMDCGGLVMEILKSAGAAPPYDHNSQMLYDYFEHRGEWNRYGIGTLVFYGKNVTAIEHVALMIDDRNKRIIEAHGNRSVTDPIEALKLGYEVRIRHIDYRKDRVAVIRPYYREIGSI